MKEFIEKLIGRLEELGWLEDTPLEEIVKELAEEYSEDTSQKYTNGWIPCSERLPEEDKIVLLCTKDGLVRQGVRHISYEHNRYDLYGVTSTFWDKEVIAWQPLPEEYKEKGKS